MNPMIRIPFLKSQINFYFCVALLYIYVLKVFDVKVHDNKISQKSEGKIADIMLLVESSWMIISPVCVSN